MALPNIVDVAKRIGIEFDPRNKANSKELRAVCPFCGHSHKFYLSINPNLNVYKCWYCKASGGVLQFEADVTGKPFADVKAQYFSQRQKPLHPAEKLSPKQLEAINLLEIYRINREQRILNEHLYVQFLGKVLKRWQKHVFANRKLAFAKLILTEKGNDFQSIINNIKQQAEKAQISTLLDDVMEMYSSNEWTEKWAKEGAEMARSAMNIARKVKDGNELIYLVLLSNQKIISNHEHFEQSQIAQ